MGPDGLKGSASVVGSHLPEQRGLVGQLVLVLVLEALPLHLLPVRLQFAVGTFGLQTGLGEGLGGGSGNSDLLTFGSACCRLYLEDFDLAAGRVDVLDVVAALVCAERVHLDPEGHALLATVLPGGELSANAVDLQGETPVGVGGCTVAGAWERGPQGT